MFALKLLGGASLDGPSGPVVGRAVQRRRLALLALLCVGRAAGQRRDKLIALLWPESDAERGRHLLSDSVYRVNQALGGDRPAISSVGDELRVDPAVLGSDARAFEEAAAAGEHERAADLYRGPLLDGFFLGDSPEFERWVDGERDRLSHLYADCLASLAAGAEQAGARSRAVGWWRRLAAHDPHNARVAISLMRALDAAGERASAIQFARTHTTLMRVDLGVEPDASVIALADVLRRDTGSGFEEVAADSSAVGTATEKAAEPPPAVGDASPVRPPAVTPPRPLATESPTPTRRRAMGGWWLVAATLVLAAAAITGFLWRSRRTTSTAASIVVLPFTNLSIDRENEYFADGMTEELTNTLANVAGLRVASRTSAFAYKNRSVDVREVGRSLGVASALEGSVRKVGNRLRITAQLVNVSDGYHLWSETYERELRDVFELQEEISRQIVRRLTGSLLGRGEVPLAERSTVDPEAYDLYLKGRFSWHQRTEYGLREAVRYFTDAIARAPRYARAFLGLADAYAVLAFYDYAPPRDAYPKAEAAARRALEIDSSLTAPFATLGYVATYYHWDWSRAEQYFRQVTAADPEYSTGHQWYANLLTVVGRFEDAEQEMRRAQQADPLSVIATAALGWTFYYARDYDRALAESRRARELNPKFELAFLWGGQALERTGRVADALPLLDTAFALSHGGVLSTLALAQALASAGRADSARALMAPIEARGAHGYVPSYEIARVHVALGGPDRALTWLERAYAERSHSMAFLAVDPQLDPLRTERRFRDLVRRVGNPPPAQ